MAKATAITHSLARLFPNPAILDILALLILQPHQRFYQTQIAELTQCSLLQTQRALRRIHDAGLVDKNRVAIASIMSPDRITRPTRI